MPGQIKPEGRTLKFEDVRVSVGSVRILNGLSLTFPPQSVSCVIGPNGAGKTSALHAMTGNLPVESGRIRWGSRSLRRMRPRAIAALGIGRKLQVPSIFADLTVRQNLDVALWAGRMGPLGGFAMKPYRWRTSMLAALETRFPFIKDESRRAGALSVGQRQMLDFALTMASEPKLVLLDEPCAGLSVKETRQMTEAMSELLSALGATGVIIEHDISVVEHLAGQVHVLHQGQLLASGTIAQIRQNPDVKSVYAGGSKA